MGCNIWREVKDVFRVFFGESVIIIFSFGDVGLRVVLDVFVRFIGWVRGGGV